MFKSPTHAVFGTANIGRSIDFFRRFGFERVERGTLPANVAQSLYGLERPLNEAILSAPPNTGAVSGWVRLVETSHSGHRSPLDCGPKVLDIYTRDLDKSIEIAEEIGATVTEKVRYRIGPILVEEAIISGPMGERIVPVLINRRRPSLLDRNPKRLFSEAHGIVWIVDSMEEAARFWIDEAGLNQVLDATTSDPELSKVLELPDPDTPVRIVLATDDSQAPIRLEFLEFPVQETTDYYGLPLHAGLHAAGFSVPNLEAAMARLPSAEFGTVTQLDSILHRRARAVTGLAPGRVRFELWEEAAS